MSLHEDRGPNEGRTRTQWLKDSAFFWLGGVILIGVPLGRFAMGGETTRRAFLIGAAAGLVAVALLGLLALICAPLLRHSVYGFCGAGVAAGTIAAHANDWDESLVFGFVGGGGLILYACFVVYMIRHWDRVGLPPANNERT